METIDTLIIGAGVVGLAIARELSLQGREVVVCEKEGLPGQGISSRNSGVIHAGLYYPNNSLKAKLCVDGLELLYRYCEEFSVPHRRLGKIVVAIDEAEQDKLIQLKANAERNGTSGLELLSREAVLQLEPDLSVSAGLWSPNTGIIDVHEFILSLIAQLETAGGAIAYGTEVTAISSGNTALAVRLNDSTPYGVQARTVINCAGLGAQAVAKTILGDNSVEVPPLHMARGNYFQMSGPSPFKQLIYPLPVKGGLGVHATLDMAGVVRFGPDVQPCDSEDYRPDESRENDFRIAVERYFPGIRDRKLSPDYVGIRPQIVRPGAFGDFRISTEHDHGVKGLINLFGIESPGLTSSLAIARYVCSVV